MGHALFSSFSKTTFTLLLSTLAFFGDADVRAGEPEYETFLSVTPDLEKELLKSNPLLVVVDRQMQIAKLQILMDRAGVSPGVINGKINDYLKHAVSVYSKKIEIQILIDDISSVDGLLASGAQDFFEEYVISEKDVAGPFVDFIPERIQDQGALEALSYLSVKEALSEKFHMDEDFLLQLNPNANFEVAGTVIMVAKIGKDLSTRVASIKANMQSRWVKAFDKNGKLIATYPASIGSPQNPSPIGSFKVRNKAGFPSYTLSATNTFEAIDGGGSVKVAPGANNPVGIAWIGLSKKSYGIHGTPEPSRVGEAGSHGCIRLTNWDAMELTRLVRTGIKVEIE